MSAIFISHSSRDHAVASELQARLSEEGHRSIFLDFDPENGLAAGRDWERELYAKLRTCQAVIVLCSEHSRASQWCFAEITQARALGKPILPVSVDGCECPSVLRDLQVIELAVDRAGAYQRLFVGLKKAGLDPADLFDWDQQRPPYPGLLAFQQQDAAVYFGREDAIQNVLETLSRLNRVGGARCVLILGASGSGKSSLIRAGVVPRLKRHPRQWLVLDPFRPMRQPFDEFAMVWAAAFAEAGTARDWKLIRKALETASEPANPAGLIELANDLRLAANRRDATVLVIVDQLEELLQADDPVANGRFLRLLRGATEQPNNPFVVVATLRSDFLGALQTDPAVRGVDYESLLLGPMEPADLVMVIEGPARLAGLELGPGLVQSMVADTAAHDALPLLAFTLRELWTKGASDGVLTAHEYRDLGRLQGAVARAAARIYDQSKLTEEQSRHLRQSFRAMVRVDDEGRPARQPARWADLPVDVHPLLERFVQARLLVSRGEGAERLLDVAHEALFRSWKDLEEWLEADRRLLIWRDRLRADLLRWNSAAQDEGGLLRGRRLLEAEVWLADHADDLSSAERTFIQASVAARERDRAARDRRRRRLVVGLAVASVFFLTLAGVTGWQWYRADQHLQRANAAVAASLWDRLDVTQGSLLNDDLVTLWAVSHASEDVREAFLRELIDRPDRLVRLGRQPKPILRALGVHWDRSDANALWAALVKAIGESTEESAISRLGDALSEAGAVLAAEDVDTTLTDLVGAIDRLTIPSQFDRWQQGTENDGAKLDVARLRALWDGVPALAGRAGQGVAHKVFDKALKEIPGHFSYSIGEPSVASVLVVEHRLEPSQKATAAKTILEEIEQTRTTSELGLLTRTLLRLLESASGEVAKAVLVVTLSRMDSEERGDWNQSLDQIARAASARVTQVDAVDALTQLVKSRPRSVDFEREAVLGGIAKELAERTPNGDTRRLIDLIIPAIAVAHPIEGLKALGAAGAILARRVPPSEAPVIVTELWRAIVKSSERDRIEVLFEVATGVAGKAGEAESERALWSQINDGNALMMLRNIAVAAELFPSRLEPDQAQALFTGLAEALRKQRIDPVAVYLLSRGAQAVPPNLTVDQAPALRALLTAVGRIESEDEAWALGRSAEALAGRFNEEEAVAVLTALTKIELFGGPPESIAKSVEVLAKHLDGPRAGRALTASLPEDTMNIVLLAHAAVPMAALASKLTTEEAETAETVLLKFRDSFLKAGSEASAVDRLASMRPAIRTLASQVSVEGADRVAAPVILALEKEEDSRRLRMLAELLAPLAERSGTVAGKGAKPLLRAMCRANERFALDALGVAWEAASAELSPSQVDSSAKSILGVLASTTDRLQLQTLQGAFRAVNTKLSAAIVRAMVADVQTQLAWQGDARSAQAAAQLLVSLSAGLSADEKSEALLEGLKYPSASSAATDVFLDALASSPDGRRPKVAGLQENVTWLAQTYGADRLNSRPKCPPPRVKGKGVKCPPAQP